MITGQKAIDKSGRKG